MWKIMKENLEDLMSPNLWRSLACETVGTMGIVLLGCGAWVQWTAPTLGEPVPNVVQISLAFGLSVATMLWVFAHISGGHFNPALTLATLATRRVSIIRGVLYIIAQVLGGILGAGILYGLTPVGKRGSLGATVIMSASGVQPAQAFGVEMLITFIFVMSYFASRDSDRTDLAGSYPLTVGLAVVVCQLFAINFTGAGMNCARSFGPAVIMDVWDNHWVYWVGPLTGGLLAGLLYDYIFSAGATVAKAQKCLLRTKKPGDSEPEKVPLDESPVTSKVIEVGIDIEKEAAVEEDKEAVTEEATDSDKAKLTENSGKE